MGAVAAFAPDLESFDSGRNFAAWLGLVPRQRSTGGRARLGAVIKMGQTDIRRLLASSKATLRGLTHVRSKTPPKAEDHACQKGGIHTRAGLAGKCIQVGRISRK